MIHAVVSTFGASSVTAVVPRPGGYEVTFILAVDVDLAIDAGLVVNGVPCAANGITKRTITVSFMDVPEYIDDDVILNKLKDFECEVKSPIVWKRDQGIYLGIRHVRVSFSEKCISLFYVVKVFDPLGKAVMLKVKHDRQSKVCNLCLGADHLYRECPQFICRHCHVQGQVRQRCPKLVVPRPSSGDDPIVSTRFPFRSDAGVATAGTSGPIPENADKIYLSSRVDLKAPLSRVASASNCVVENVSSRRPMVSGGGRERASSHPPSGRRNFDNHFPLLRTVVRIIPVMRRCLYLVVGSMLVWLQWTPH